MERSVRCSIFLSACCVAISMPVLAEGPFSFDSAPGRLPKTVVPIRYEVAITPDIEAMTIQGTESVVVEFRSATDTVRFNSAQERLSDVRLDGQPVRNVESDDEKEWTTLKLDAPAASGRHTLTFSYSGRIETRPRGLFLQHYTVAGGAQGAMLSTQMEAADARRMFPCWDEPAFRAEFQLTVTVPASWAAVSNMPAAKREPHGSVATTTFQSTPKMPSYLVELSAGDLAQITATGGGVKFGVWAVRGREQYGKGALADAQLILADYDDYFAYRYPLPKLDSIAIPGGFSGAMENWGAITYNDEALLVLPSSTLSARQTVFSIQAHEMAHLWFGDLVTMGWWDDVWLNESFASWMAARETELRHPQWHWWEAQNGSKENAMAADARAGSPPIQQHVVNEIQANNAFDPAIVYDKGQAILRMFEAHVGPDTFRAAIRAYIKARAFSNATTTDLWNGLNAASGKNISQIAADWTTQPGFPLVSVAATCDPSGQRTLHLTQSRFLLQGSDPNHSHWSIPLQVRVGAQGAPQAVLFKDDGQTVPAGRCAEPLSLDANAIGFYRVRYDAASLATNTKSFAQLPSGDRIALLDDEWALVGSGREPLSAYLALATSMGGDLNVRAWEQVESALSTIEYAERGTAEYGAFTAYARSVLRPAYARLGWDPKPGEALDVAPLRRAVLTDLGEWGDPAVIAEARNRMNAFVRGQSKLSPDDLVPVLDIVARRADAATFEKLHALAKDAKDEAGMGRYYSALMRVSDNSLAAEAVQIALSSELPPELEHERFSLIAILAEEHQGLAWKTFSEHSKQLLASHSPFDALIIAQYVPSIFWSGVPLDQMESWVQAHVPAEMSDAVERGMESARYKLARKQLLLSSADAWKAS